MDRRILRWLTIILPVGFIGIMLVISDLFLIEGLTPIEVVFALLLVAVGAFLFSNWVFGQINQWS